MTSAPEPTASGGLAAWRAGVAARKRAVALDAALGLFLEKGYAATSLEDVARAAGVSSATVYKHFPTKADLFGGVAARFWENEPGAAPPTPAPGDPRAGLQAIGTRYAELLGGDAVVALFRLIIAEVPRFPDLGAQLYALGKKPYLERLDDYLRAEVEAGTLAIEDRALAARQFLGMINDVLFWPRLLVPSLKPDAAERDRVVDEAAATFLARHAPRAGEGGSPP